MPLARRALTVRTFTTNHPVAIMTQLRHLTALLVLLVTLPSIVSAQNWQWARFGRGSDHDAASRVTLDSLGNTFVLGRYAGGISFNSTLLSGIGLWDLFVAKYNPAGTLQWATSITGPGNDLPGDIDVDRAGNIYVSGSFAGNTILAGRSITSAGNSDAFVAKLSPTGVVQWARTGGGPGNDFGTGLDLDEPGAFVYITGAFSGTALFDGESVTSSGGTDIFVARYATADGGLQWVRGGGGPRDDMSVGLGVDRFGSAFIAGTFSDSATFLSQRISTPGSDSGAVFITKFDFAGIPRWASSAGVLPLSYGPLSVAVDPEGNTFIAGSFVDSITIGTTTLVSEGRSDAFLARYNPFGGFRWAVRVGDTLNDFGLGAGVDNSGNPYLTGALDNTGTMTLDTTYTERLFVSRYNPLGELLWMETSETGRIARGLDVGVDRLGNHVIGGQFFDTLRLDDIRLVATGGRSDAFIAKLGPDATIATSPLTDSVACAGGTFNVNFSTGGSFFTDNRFLVQLSDSNGGFGAPIIIGSRTSAAAGTILASLPAWLPSGAAYRVRVVATSPVATGSDNGSNLRIVGLPHPSITSGIDDTLCAGESVTLDAGEGYTGYRWSTGAQTRTITVAQSGRYWVAVTTSPGCEGRSDTAAITVMPAPPKPVITQIGSRLEVFAGYTHQWYRNGVAIPGATRERFTPTEPGTYTVTVFDIAGCNATSDPFEFTIGAVREELSDAGIAIERVDRSHIVVSTVSTKRCDLAVTLTSVEGRTVRSFDHGDRIVVDLGELATVAFLLRVRGCDGKDIVRKVTR
jgi:hypothetical protein